MFSLVRYHGLGRDSVKLVNSLREVSPLAVFRHYITVVILFVFLPLPSMAQVNVTLNWHAPIFNTNGSALHDLDGYLLHWGTSPGAYEFTVDVGNATSYTMEGLGYGRTYYFSAQAYTTTNEKSAFSNEMVVPIPLSVGDGYDPSPGSPGSGTPSEPAPDVGAPSDDYDGDGLTNEEEDAIGTNPANRDSDGDGIDDGQELEDGTNPNDKGSVIGRLPSKICAEWNGFLDMYNIFEHVNLSERVLRVNLELRDMNGRKQSSMAFDIDPGAQFDVLAHDINGHQMNSFGMVCSTHNGQAGDLDGRMVYYRQNPSNPSLGFEFAFAMPVSEGLKGSQFVGFNTFQPSLRSADQGNLVANWLQLTNMESSSQSGQLIVYDAQGRILACDPLTVAAGARVDTPLHSLGSSIVGLVEWRPDSANARFVMRNARYMYDNSGWRNSFATAFFLGGEYGSGELRVVPLNTAGATAVLELSNVLSEEVDAEVKIFDARGSVLQTLAIQLAAHATHHVIADPILQGRLGMASVEANKASSLLISAMQYGRKTDSSIKYMYGVGAAEPRASNLRGSYNTFLGQDSQVVVVNTNDIQQQASISVGAPKGDLSAQVTDFQVADKGVLTFSLGEPANTYGMVKVQPEAGAKLAAWVLRVLPTADGSDIADIIPIQLR